MQVTCPMSQTKGLARDPQTRLNLFKKTAGNQEQAIVSWEGKVSVTRISQSMSTP